MITSKLTTKAQTTLPRAVRSALGVGPGDELAYTIEGDIVTLSRAGVGVAEDPFATFSEWDSEADRKAYADL
jgi:antitoxin PrlF